MNMHDRQAESEQRQNYVRQKMDASVHELQRRLMDKEQGSQWHQVLRRLLSLKTPQEAAAQLQISLED